MPWPWSGHWSWSTDRSRRFGEVAKMAGKREESVAGRKCGDGVQTGSGCGGGGLVVWAVGARAHNKQHSPTPTPSKATPTPTKFLEAAASSRSTPVTTTRANK